MGEVLVRTTLFHHFLFYREKGHMHLYNIKTESLFLTLNGFFLENKSRQHLHHVFFGLFLLSNGFLGSGGYITKWHSVICCLHLLKNIQLSHHSRACIKKGKEYFFKFFFFWVKM